MADDGLLLPNYSSLTGAWVLDLSRWVFCHIVSGAGMHKAAPSEQLKAENWKQRNAMEERGHVQLAWMAVVHWSKTAFVVGRRALYPCTDKHHRSISLARKPLP